MTEAEAGQRWGEGMPQALCMPQALNGTGNQNLKSGEIGMM